MKLTFEIASPGFHEAIGSAFSVRLGTVLAYIEEHLMESIYLPMLAVRCQESARAPSEPLDVGLSTDRVKAKLRQVDT